MVCKRKKVSEKWMLLQDSVFHRRKSKAESSCLSRLIYHSAACETTKRQVKDEVILNYQSNHNNLGELVLCQGYGFPSVADKTEAVKSKEELLMEKLKQKEEKVKYIINECLRFRGMNSKKNSLKN